MPKEEIGIEVDRLYDKDQVEKFKQTSVVYVVSLKSAVLFNILIQ